MRLMDLPADLRDALHPGSARLPPASLRRRVGGVSRRREFLEVGRATCEDIRAALVRLDVDIGSLATWLDFGCGAGRVARHVAALSFVREIWGIDVDRDAVSWARRHLPGRYETVSASPPTGLPAGSFDAVCAISVFTHFDESTQRSWLAELHRVMKPGALLIATTNSPSLSSSRPDMTDSQRETLFRDGFLFVRGGGRDFNEETAFQTNEYLRRTWGAFFGQLIFIDYGVGGYQDLSVWKKW
jgi:SAM-dependent methyltransferase